MDWIKLKTNLLTQRIPDDELLAIAKYQLLWGLIEERPTEECARRYMTARQLRIANAYITDIERSVNADIKASSKHRERSNNNYHKNKDLDINSASRQTADRQQTDSSMSSQKRREEKRIDNLSSDKFITPISPLDENKQKPVKKTYGEFSKVKLTDDEYSKLKTLYGEKLGEAIQVLDDYIAQKGDKYKSHYAVMKTNNWVYEKIFKMAQPDNPSQQQRVISTHYETKDEHNNRVLRNFLAQYQQPAMNGGENGR